MSEQVDHLIIGGGAYGLHIATSLAEAYPNHTTTIVEQADELATRASLNNHGRLHHGYMYAENPGTAIESRNNVSRFSSDYSDTINHDVTSYYGIHANSKMSPDEYEAFCKNTNLPYERHGKDTHGLFGEDIVASFRTQELTFSTHALRKRMIERARQAGADIQTGWEVSVVQPEHANLRAIANNEQSIVAKYIFNCAYAGINGVHARSGLPLLPSTYAEFSLFKMNLPDVAKNVSATVMCGPYASIVSNNDAGTHVLGHVTFSGNEKQRDFSPGKRFTQEELAERYAMTVEEAQKYLPIVSEGQWDGQITEVKSFIGNKPGEAARIVHTAPNYAGLENYNVVMGGKVSSFYDAGAFALAKVGGGTSSFAIAS